MFGKGALALFVLVLGACAKPKYETVIYSNGNTGGEKAVDCTIRMKVSKLCVQWKWETLPTERSEGALIFKLVRENYLDGSAVPVDADRHPEVVLWMPEMGHGSTPTKTQWHDVGTYRVWEVFFIMPGQWQIRIQLKNGEVIEDETIIPFTL